MVLQSPFQDAAQAADSSSAIPQGLQTSDAMLSTPRTDLEAPLLSDAAEKEYERGTAPATPTAPSECSVLEQLLAQEEALPCETTPGGCSTAGGVSKPATIPEYQ